VPLVAAAEMVELKRPPKKTEYLFLL